MAAAISTGFKDSVAGSSSGCPRAAGTIEVKVESFVNETQKFIPSSRTEDAFTLSFSTLQDVMPRPCEPVSDAPSCEPKKC